MSESDKLSAGPSATGDAELQNGFAAPNGNSSTDAASDVESKEGNSLSSNGDSRKRRRKSNRPYPPSSFEEAVKFAKDIYDFGSGAPVRKLTFYNHLGRSPESSASRDAITNANKYGLIKASFSAEQIELTNQAINIVGDSASERERTRSKIALGIENIEPFKSLYERLSGNRLPAKSALVDAMIEIGIPPELGEEAVDIFIVNLRFVGLLQVLSGAERVVSIDHLLDSLPSGGSLSRERQSTSVIGPQAPSKDAPAQFDTEIANLDNVCFYIAPIGAANSDARKHSDLFLGSIVEPAIMSLGLKVVRADSIGQSGIITRQILDYILKSRLVVADLSFHNPNVFYELALRHAVRLPIVQIIRHSDNIPFDINQMRTISIDDSDIYTFVPNLELYRSEVASQARRALEPNLEVDNPISVYFPSLRVNVS